MNKKIKILLVMLSVLTFVGIGVFAVKEYMITKNPVNHLEYSLLKMYNEENFDASVKMNFDISKATLKELNLDDDMVDKIDEMLDKLFLGYDFKIITNDPDKWINFEQSYKLNYDEAPLLDFGVILDQEVFGIGFNNFYNKYFVIKYESILKEALELEDINLDGIDLKKYVELIEDKKSDEYKALLKNVSKYKNIFDEYLERHLTKDKKTDIVINDKSIKVTNYKLDIDVEDYFKMIKELGVEASNDKELETYCKYKVVKVLELIIELEDYEDLGLEKKDIEEAVEVFKEKFSEVFDDFFAGYLGAFDELDYSYMTYDDIIEDTHYIISIDRKHRIRQLRANVTTEYISSEVLYTFNKFGKDVVIEDRKDDYIDLMNFYDFENEGALKNEEEFAKLLKDIVSSGIDEILEGKGYKSLFEDLKFFEDYVGISIDEYLEELEMIKIEWDNYKIEDFIDLFLSEF